MGGLALAVAAMIRATTAQGGTLWVSFPSQSEACGYTELQAALHARLGDVDIQPGPHDVAGNDVGVDLERDSATSWELRVHLRGERELQRQLSKSETSCVEFIETSALMIERYLDDIHWAGDRALVLKLPPVPPKPPPPPWHMFVQVGGAVAAGALGLTPAVTFDLGARRGHWQLALSGELQRHQQTTVSSSASTEVPEEATLTLQSAAAQLSAGYLVTTGVGALSFELTPGAEFFWASTMGGNLPHHGSALTAVPFLGLRLGYATPIWHRLFLSLQVEARVHSNVDFVVTGAPDFTVSTGNVDGYLSLGLAYVFL